MSYPLYGNVIIDSSNSTALGGTLTISNSCNTSSLNNRASIAFAVADISYGILNRGLFSNNVDFADARITALIDTVSPTVGTGLSVSVSPNHVNPPVEALRIRSNGNVGIGTQTPQFPLDVSGIVNFNTGVNYYIYNSLPPINGSSTALDSISCLNIHNNRVMTANNQRASCINMFTEGGSGISWNSYANFALGTHPSSNGASTLDINLGSVPINNVYNLVTAMTISSRSTTNNPVCVGIGTTSPSCALDVNGEVLTRGNISCIGNINVPFPINTTYTALPTFTNTQVGRIISNVWLTSVTMTNGSIAPFNILYNIPPGIWMANYSAHVEITVTNNNFGNITVGMTTVPPGGSYNNFPTNFSESYGVQRTPIFGAASIPTVEGPFVLSGTAVIPFSSTGTLSMLGSIIGFGGNTNKLNRSVLTVTRIA